MKALPHLTQTGLKLRAGRFTAVAVFAAMAFAAMATVTTTAIASPSRVMPTPTAQAQGEPSLGPVLQQQLQLSSTDLTETLAQDYGICAPRCLGDCLGKPFMGMDPTKTALGICYAACVLKCLSEHPSNPGPGPNDPPIANPF